jgi:hypothetical protein
MKPFLFNEVFDVNTNLVIKNPGVASLPAVVIDDFLKHPEEAREVVGMAPAANWKHVEGGCNFVDYYRLPAALSDPVSEQHGLGCAPGRADGLFDRHPACGRERRRQLVHADP